MENPKMSKKDVFFLLLSFLVFGCILMMPIATVRKQTVALLVLFAIQLATACVPNIVAAMILAVLTIGMGVLEMPVFLSNFGTSPFIMVTCLLFLATGAKSTQLGARLSYYLIYKIGSSPKKLVLAFMISVTILSMFIADIPATMIIMAVAVNVLETCEERKGGSLGKALSLACCWGSITGGLGLLSGSTANITGVSMLEKVTNGAFTVTFGEWAILGIPFSLLMIYPSYWIICKFYKLEHYQVRTISKDTVKAKLDALGSFTNAEKKYLTIMTLVISLFATSTKTGMPLQLITMIGMLLMVFPTIGVLDFKIASKTIPWDSLLLIGVTYSFSTAIVNSGMGQMIVDMSLGWLEGFDYWIVIIFISLLGFLLHFPFTCNPNGLVAVYVAAIVPLALSMFADIHPGFFFLPAIFTGTASFLNPVGAVFFLTHEFGYSKFKDPFLPGVLMVIPFVAVLTVLACVLLPLNGWVS